MKTKKLLYILLLLIAVIFACRKDFSIETDTQSNFLTQVKDFYYKETKGLGIVAVSRQKSSIGIKSSAEVNAKIVRSITPLWYKSYVSKAGEIDLTEVPFVSNNKVIALYNFGKKSADTRINLIRANASFQRLLIYKTKLGNFHQLQLTYIPDYDYLEKNHFDASANQINKIKEGFSGYIEYSSLKDEKKIFVLRFEKGKLVSKIYFKNKNATKNVNGIKQNTKSGSSIMSVKDNGNIVNSGRYEEQCTPVLKQECFEVGDPPVESCGEWIQVGETCEDVWVEDPPEGPGDDPCYDEYFFYICDPENPENPENPEEPSPPVDCAGVLLGTAVMADCGCIGGTTGIEDCSKEPCDEADRMNYQSVQAQLAAENLALSNTPNDIEYGTEERLTSIPGNDYNSSDIRSNGVHGFTPTFTWNVSEGFTIGFNHKHTNGTGPSPADIMTPYEFSARPALISSGQQQYYKDNVTIGTISGSNYYKMTIADWGAVGTIYNANTSTQLITKYQDFANDYFNNNSSATIASASEYALMKIFGSSINFYKKDPNTGKYEPYKVDTNGNIQNISCP